MAKYRLLPLYGKHGAGKFAKVDPDTYEWAVEHRWLLTGSSAYLYPGRYVRGTLVLLHRQVMGEPDCLVDHIDGDRLNATRANLRTCTHAENMRNRRGARNGTSKYKGVSWSKEREKWKAEIKMAGRRSTLGRFDDEQEAALAYDSAARLLHGEFARTNF